MVSNANSQHTKKIVNSYNKWVNEQHSLYTSTDHARKAELARLQAEIGNLMESVVAGVNAAALSSAINERATEIERLQNIGSVELPQKTTEKDLESQAAHVRRVAELVLIPSAA